MRSINLSEEEIKTLKEFIAITVRTYGDAYHQGKVSFKNYNRMDNILSRLYNLKKTRVRYDKTKTQGYKARLCQKKGK